MFHYPDLTKLFIVTTDLFQYAIEVLLTSEKIGSVLSTVYASRTSIQNEVNYSVIGKEFWIVFPL